MKRSRKHWAKRLLLWGVGLVALLALGLWLVAQWAFEPERLVKRLEARYNLRAEIAAVTRTSLPARLEVRGLVLGQRDDFARKAVPLAARSPLAAPVLTVDRITMDVSLASLLFGKIKVRELSANKITATIERLPDSDTTIGRLFDKPDQPPKKKKRKRKLPGQETEREREEVEHRFNADNLPIAAQLTAVGLSDVTITYLHPKKKTRIQLTEGQAWLRNIELDRSDLANRNRADLEMQAKISVDRLEKNLHYGDLVVRATGTITPFDLETRELMPEVNGRLDILEGTHVNPVPMVEKLTKQMAEYAKYGLAVGDLSLRTDFQKEAFVALRFKDELATLTQDTEIVLPDYRIQLKKDSWFETEEHQHRFESEVWVSPPVTKKLLAGLGKLAEDKVKVLSPESFERILAKRLVDDGKLRVRLETTGDIGDPEVDFMKNLPQPEDLIEEALKEAARDPKRLLKGLKGLLD